MGKESRCRGERERVLEGTRNAGQMRSWSEWGKFGKKDGVRESGWIGRTEFGESGVGEEDVGCSRGKPAGNGGREEVGSGFVEVDGGNGICWGGGRQGLREDLGKTGRRNGSTEMVEEVMWVRRWCWRGIVAAQQTWTAAVA